MTPREALAQQSRRPQLPAGWRIPDHPANRCAPPQKQHPAGIVGTTHHARLLSYLRMCAAAGYLPYYDELRVVLGVDPAQLASALQCLVACGEIQRAVGHSKRGTSPEWCCAFDGVTMRTPNARDLDVLPQRKEAPGSVQVRVLRVLRECVGDKLPVQAEMARRAGVARKSFAEALQRLNASGVISYASRASRQNRHSPNKWRVEVDGRVLVSEGWVV